ncbi:MAG: 50S ribosomal protein L1 [Candidatus Riflebacteria bacterium]|nr:50S ribosomal protein L1 [Candidatus Riflebacteria bacterium]
MMKRGKKYREAVKSYDPNKAYSLTEASEIVKRTAKAKFDESIELTVNLGVDPRHADQQARGTVALPRGTGKKIRVLVIAGPDKAREALEAGADFAGGPEIVEKISGENWMEFDKLIATPDMMKHVGKLGKQLGPRGLMPNPKVGTVTPNVAPAVKALKAGQVEYKVDKGGVVHLAAGKASFEARKIEENLLVVLNAILKAKPSVAKGTYMKKVTVGTTMGPGIRVDVNLLKNAIDEAKKTRFLA